MVEVLKTNVVSREQATMLLDKIHQAFVDYVANFDLEDKDSILRVQCSAGAVHTLQLINFLKKFGIYAEALKDDGPVTEVFRFKQLDKV